VFDSADKIIVIAREEGSSGTEGITLFMIDSGAENLDVRK
jgi:alkylation response protein AidB-like acyl-CoA dehydrogenase